MQGMGTALQRIGQSPEGATGGGVSNDDPDLVAYWTFDEGRGYIVHDATQRGHDLYLTSEPHWEVGSPCPRRDHLHLHLSVEQPGNETKGRDKAPKHVSSL